MLKWQIDQYDHDKRNHGDVFSLHRNDRLKHYGLHFAKYVGRIARGENEEKSMKQTIIDTLLVCLSSANTMQQKLEEVEQVKGFESKIEEFEKLADYSG